MINAVIINQYYPIMDNLEMLSLFDRYAELRKVNPAQDLIQAVMEATGRSEICVRMWLSTHKTPPKHLCKLIADKLGVSADILFPDSENNSNTAMI